MTDIRTRSVSPSRYRPAFKRAIRAATLAVVMATQLGGSSASAEPEPKSAIPDAPRVEMVARLLFDTPEARDQYLETASRSVVLAFKIYPTLEDLEKTHAGSRSIFNRIYRANSEAMFTLVADGFATRCSPILAKTMADGDVLALWNYVSSPIGKRVSAALIEPGDAADVDTAKSTGTTIGTAQLGPQGNNILGRLTGDELTSFKAFMRSDAGTKFGTATGPLNACLEIRYADVATSTFPKMRSELDRALSSHITKTVAESDAANVAKLQEQLAALREILATLTAPTTAALQPVALGLRADPKVAEQFGDAAASIETYATSAQKGAHDAFLISFNRDPTAQRIEARYPGAREAILKATLGGLNEMIMSSYPAIRSRIAEASREYFTTSELSALTGFFKSPLWQKLQKDAAATVDVTLLTDKIAADPSLGSLTAGDLSQAIDPTIVARLSDSDIDQLTKFNNLPVGVKWQRFAPILNRVLLDSITTVVLAERGRIQNIQLRTMANFIRDADSKKK